MKNSIHSASGDVQVIQWKNTKKLKWTDFKKKDKPNFKASAVAAIGFQSKPLIEYIRNENKFRFKIKEMQFYAIFIPNYSWYGNEISKKDQMTLLNHEQGHFDLAEEITRKESKKTNNRFQDKIFSTKGKSEEAAIKNAISQVNTIRNKIEYKIQNEFKIQETEYDKKTNHGLIKIHQNAYDERFRKLRE